MKPKNISHRVNTDIQLSPDVAIPLDAVTQTFAVLAVKGSGKSYLSSVMAEEMLKNNQQIVVLDPTGAWWGLQSSADGKKEGFPIVIFGGDHANVPLEENAGEIIAQAIVEQGFSAIIDLSLFRVGEANRFVGKFLETLYRINRQPLHLFVDEADAYAPQKPFGDQARTLGAMEYIVRRGRKKGIGCTMITQRPAVINKDVLTQCEILIALRMSHPKDINAIMEWVKVHASTSEAKTMTDSLPSMKTGNAWIWSPSWLKIFKRTAIRKRETFDSGATPKVGERILPPKKLAQIDVKVLGEKINETMERKKADDPAILRKKIADLEKQLKNTPVIGTISNEIELKKIRAELFSKIEQVELLQAKVKSAYDFVKKHSMEMHNWLQDQSIESTPLIPDKRKRIEREIIGEPRKGFGKNFLETPKPEPFYSGQKSAQLPAKDWAGESPGQGNLGKCEKAILSALGQQSGPCSKSKLGILSGYSSTSGSFGNSLSKLRKLGYIDNMSDISITELGISVAVFNPLPQPGPELQQYWLGKLPKCERAILDYLIQVFPVSPSKHDLGVATGYAASSGSFGNALSKLRTLELIEGKNELKAVSSLF